MPSKFQQQVISVTSAGDIDYVKTGVKDARIQFAQAEAHFKSATKVVDEDWPGSFILTYEAARKSVQAVLAAHGMRIKKFESAHKVIVAISTVELFDQVSWKKLDWMRTRRHDVQYANPDKPDVTLQDCEVALAAARLMLDDAAKIIESLA